MIVKPHAKKRGGSVMAEINITPLTDVVLVLMIIMMVGAAGLGAATALNVNLPASRTAEPVSTSTQNVGILVQKDNHVYLQGYRIAVSELAGRLKALHAEKPVGKVFISADRDVRWERVVDVMDQVKLAGLYDISFPTKLLEERR